MYAVYEYVYRKLNYVCRVDLRLPLPPDSGDAGEPDPQRVRHLTAGPVRLPRTAGLDAVACPQVQHILYTLFTICFFELFC
jgi:hypothetical protein